MSTRLAVAVIAVCASLAAVGCRRAEPLEILSAPAEHANLVKYWSLPDFSLTERGGKAVRLGDLAGKVWVADFFYSSCPGPCPMLTSRFSEVQKALAAEDAVRLVSISVDPEKDTPAVLQSYAQRFGAGERWLFLTGEKAAIYRLAREGFKLPVAEPETAGGLITHTTRLILVDRHGTVRGFYEGVGEDGTTALVRDVRRLLAEK